MFTFHVQWRMINKTVLLGKNIVIRSLHLSRFFRTFFSRRLWVFMYSLQKGFKLKTFSIYSIIINYNFHFLEFSTLETKNVSVMNWQKVKIIVVFWIQKIDLKDRIKMFGSIQLFVLQLVFVGLEKKVNIVCISHAINTRLQFIHLIYAFLLFAFSSLQVDS